MKVIKSLENKEIFLKGTITKTISQKDVLMIFIKNMYGLFL